MEIWIVEEGDRYEGMYNQKFFFKEKDAVKFAKEEHDISEFEMRQGNYFHEPKTTHWYISVHKDEVV